MLLPHWLYACRAARAGSPRPRTRWSLETDGQVSAAARNKIHLGVIELPGCRGRGELSRGTRNMTPDDRHIGDEVLYRDGVRQDNSLNSSIIPSVVLIATDLAFEESILFRSLFLPRV